MFQGVTVISEQTAADLLAYVDEAGERGLLRDLTQDRDAQVSVLCALPIPAEHLACARQLVEPLYGQFKAAAPPGAKLHITEAFRPGNERWRAVAEQVRSNLFATMQEIRVIVIYVARRCRVARQSFEAVDAFRKAAQSNRRSKIKIVGNNREPDDRIEDDLMISLALMLDHFAEQEARARVDIMFDQIDAPIAKRYEEALEDTRRVSKNQTTVRGWNPETKERLTGTIGMSANAPFRIDSKYLGKISVVGKDDPLIFATDVVANSLWRHLCGLPPEAKLNEGISVEGWPLAGLVWAKDHEKNFDLF